MSKEQKNQEENKALHIGDVSKSYRAMAKKKKDMNIHHEAFQFMNQYAGKEIKDFAELIAEFAIMRLKKEWIPINLNRLPVGEVLIQTISKRIMIGDVYEGGWRTNDAYWKKENGKMKLVTIPLKEVTHYQPIPESVG
jgi:hypothetical protein